MVKQKLRIVVSSSWTSFYINDITGIYNAMTNPEGYGGINDNILVFINATLSILAPNATSPVIINVFPSFPTTNDSINIEVTNIDLNFASGVTFPIGVYTFAYNLYKDSNLISNDTTYLFIDPITCCLSKQLLKIETNKSICDEIKVRSEKLLSLEKLNLLYLDLQAAQQDLICNKKVKAQSIVEYVNKQCSSGCGCCKGC